LSVHEDKLRYFPADVVDSNPALKARLIEHKKTLISLLASGSTINGSTIQPPPERADSAEGGGSTIQSGSTITSPDPGVESEWDPGTARLIQWFITEGQHRLPAQPFYLTE